MNTRLWAPSALVLLCASLASPAWAEDGEHFTLDITTPEAVRQITGWELPLAPQPGPA